MDGFSNAMYSTKFKTKRRGVPIKHVFGLNHNRFLVVKNVSTCTMYVLFISNNHSHHLTIYHSYFENALVSVDINRFMSRTTNFSHKHRNSTNSIKFPQIHSVPARSFEGSRGISEKSKESNSYCS